MEIAMKYSSAMDLDEKFRTVANIFRVSKIEEYLSDVLENMPKKSSIDYIGELNKSDIFH